MNVRQEVLMPCGRHDGEAPAFTARQPSERDDEFEALMMPFLDDVMRFARVLTRDPTRTDDLVQETYLQALRGWHTFHPGANPKRWLLAICHHAFVRMLRQESRYVDAPEDDPELSSLATARAHYEAERSGIVDVLDRMNLKAAIDDALGTLPPRYLAVIQLIDIDAQSYELTAAILDVPIGTVRSRLFRARRLLQDQLLVYARDAGIRTRMSDVAHPPSPIDCERAVRRLWDYIDDRLTPGARDEVEAHLATCGLCAPRFTFARAMKNALGQLDSADALLQLDEHCRNSLRARLREVLGHVTAEATEP
jgi:RNA polymerase sigma-70 factor, ECF subfamily